MNIPKNPPPVPRFPTHGRSVETWPGPKLLVSVRSAAEAETAVAGGADLIDVKEPRRGSLGQAPDATIRDVLRQVAGRTPVSAAMGEGKEDEAGGEECGALTFRKWGLAGFATENWQSFLRRKDEQYGAEKVVCVAYADATRAGSPAVAEVVNFACQTPGRVLLIDTFAKEPALNLLSWLSREELTGISRTCRAAGVRLALAGSLGPGEIADLWDLRPDWFAVRGAVCSAGRESVLDERKIRRLAHLVHFGVMTVPDEMKTLGQS